MSTIELKLNSIELNLPKRERSIYFILSATTAESPNTLVVTHLPDSGFLTLGKHENSYNFVPDGDPEGGLFLFSTDLPASKTMLVRLTVMESHQGLKDIGQVLSGVNGFVVNNIVDSTLFKAIAGVKPVVMSGFQTASAGLAEIGNALSKAGDTQIGFISMDQSFNTITLPLNCTQTMMSGNGKISWNWSACPVVETVPAVPN